MLQIRKRSKLYLKTQLGRLQIAHRNMLRRCYNPSDASFNNYGGRGIQVCSAWLKSRDAFTAWALTNGHEIGLTLDRRDNDKNYSPSNCRWVTMKVQQLNKRTNRLLTQGGETKPLTAWAGQLGINADTLSRRLDVYNIPLEQALTSGRLNAWEHGSRAGYEKHKCKCDLCRASNAARHRAARARRKT